MAEPSSVEDNTGMLINTMYQLWLIIAALWVNTSLVDAETLDPCPATPREDRLPEVIAPMAGEEPIWLVDGSAGEWRGARLVKAVWVVSRGAVADLSITGRRLDGPGSLLFQVDRTPSKKLESSDLEGRWVTPGGATAEIMDRYAFAPMYLIYPSSGCWQITVRVGGEERRIVVELVEPSAEE